MPTTLSTSSLSFGIHNNPRPQTQHLCPTATPQMITCVGARGEGKACAADRWLLEAHEQILRTALMTAQHGLTQDWPKLRMADLHNRYEAEDRCVCSGPATAQRSTRLTLANPSRPEQRVTDATTQQCSNDPTTMHPGVLSPCRPKHSPCNHTHFIASTVNQPSNIQECRGVTAAHCVCPTAWHQQSVHNGNSSQPANKAAHCVHLYTAHPAAAAAISTCLLPYRCLSQCR